VGDGRGEHCAGHAGESWREQKVGSGLGLDYMEKLANQVFVFLFLRFFHVFLRFFLRFVLETRFPVPAGGSRVCP
jgi:hypothetical protein